MKFSVMPDALKSAYAAVKTVVPSKASMPVLESVLFKPSDDGKSFDLIGSDGDTTVIMPMAVEDAVDVHPFLIDGSFMQNVVGNLGEWVVDIEVSDKREIVISDFLGEFKTISSYDANEYPIMKEMKDAHSITVDAASFVSCCMLAAPFTSNDKDRPQMSSIALDIRNDGLRVVASDAKTLYLNIIREVCGECDFVVKLKRVHISAASAMFSQAEGDKVVVTFNDKSVRLSQGGAVIASVQVDGKYPRYEAVIPKNNNSVVCVDIANVRAAVKRVSFTSEVLKFTFDGNSKMIIECKDACMGTSSKVTIDTESQENVLPGFVSGLRASFFQRVLSALNGSKKAFILFNEPHRAFLVKSERDGDLTTLIMPCKAD